MINAVSGDMWQRSQRQNQPLLIHAWLCWLQQIMYEFQPYFSIHGPRFALLALSSTFVIVLQLKAHHC